MVIVNCLTKGGSMKNSRKKIFIQYLLVFLIPVTLLSITYYLLRITPFGENSLLTIDLNGQYISYFAYLKNSLLNQDSLLYSFSKTMSGEMIGLTAYYLLSPFNLIFLFSDVSKFPLMLTFLTLLKIGAAGMTMYHYLKREKLSFYLLILLSTSYALSSYLLVYQQNIMWLDGVVILPIIILGIDRILDGNKKYLYPLVLSFSLITNYYIGYMLCIFSVIYFGASLIERIVDSSKYIYILPRLGTVIWNFIKGSLLAGGISAFVLIPTVFSLRGGKAEFDISTLLNFESNFTVTDFFSKFMIGAFDYGQLQSGLPNIYVSLLVSTTSILFFFNKGISKGTKLKYLVLLMVVFMSFKINGVNLVWHGFNTPTWFPYRYSFIFSYLLIILSTKYLKQPHTSKIPYFITSLFLLYITYKVWYQDYNYLDQSKILISVFFLLTWLLVVMINKKIFWIFGIILISTELVFNNYLTLKENDYRGITNFYGFVSQNEDLINRLNPGDKEFYRIEKNYSYSPNDALLLGYPGLSHYSSSEKDYVKEFLGNLGYRNNGNWARYSYGSSLLADSFMGVRYILSTIEIPNYKLIGKENNIYIYENQNYFPFSYEIESENTKESIIADNTFEYQNLLFESLFGLKQIYKSIDEDQVERTTINLEQIENGNMNIHFKKKNSSEDAFLQYEFSGIKDKVINFYFPTTTFHGAEIYLDGKLISRQLETNANTISSFLSTEDSHIVTVRLLTNDLIFQKELFYKYSLEELDYISNLANNSRLEITEINPTYIGGILSSNESDSTLVTSIPYDPGWHVTIDSVKAEVFPIHDTLLGVEIPPDAKNIKMKFLPQGIRLGIITSILSMIVLVIENVSIKEKKLKESKERIT